MDEVTPSIILTSKEPLLISKEKEPIIQFKDLKEANECLDYWQKKLFLTDWLIKLVLHDDILKNANGEECEGLTNYVFMRKSSLITISKLPKDTGDFVGRLCQEETLIHELLHLKYNWLVVPSTLEGQFLDEIDHQLLEQMAKTLLMAKYDLEFSWFKNF